MPRRRSGKRCSARRSPSRLSRASDDGQTTTDGAGRPAAAEGDGTMQRGWKTAALALIAAATVTSTAFAQRQGRGAGGFGGGATIRRMPEVQGELKLTD